MTNTPGLGSVISQIARADRGRLLSVLIARLGDFSLAEDVLSDAFESALVHWARGGVPDNPQGWLLRVARRKAIDRIRRDARFRGYHSELTRLAQEDEMDQNTPTPDIPDKRLALIFTCCHPALDPKSRVALTLRTLGGLSTAEIARAFLDKETTMGQRLSRAKSKIRHAKIPFRVPGPDNWDDRLSSVLAVVYLIFNEGYAASSGAKMLRSELCEEAIYLARMLDRLKPDEPEIGGLLSLMLSTHARRGARLDADGAIVPLDEQAPENWDQEMIKQALAVLDDAISVARSGPYQIKAAISALHVSRAPNQEPDWGQIVLLYDSLARFEPTPVVLLNRAMALAHNGHKDKAMTELDQLAPDLQTYQPFHAARADLLAYSGETHAALDAYEQAIALAGNGPEKAFLRKRRDRMRH